MQNTKKVKQPDFSLLFFLALLLHAVATTITTLAQQECWERYMHREGKYDQQMCIALWEFGFHHITQEDIPFLVRVGSCRFQNLHLNKVKNLHFIILTQT